FLGSVEVDVRSEVGSLGHDHDTVGSNLEEPAEDREMLLRAALADRQLTGTQRRDQRSVVGQDAELSLAAGQRDGVDRVAVRQPPNRSGTRDVGVSGSTAG